MMNSKRFFAKRTGIRVLMTLAIILALVAPGVGALAEATSSPVYDYVSTLGFAPMDVGAASEDGLDKCYMQETMEYQTISFMENGRQWMVMEINGLGAWDPDDMRELFTTLIADFDWDVSFYDTTTSEKFECSYGIKSDLRLLR